MTEQKLRPPFIEADWPTKIEYMNENENFYHSDGLEVVELGQGWVHMVMPVQKRHLNLQGQVHGGWLAALPRAFNHKIRQLLKAQLARSAGRLGRRLQVLFQFKSSFLPLSIFI